MISNWISKDINYYIDYISINLPYELDKNKLNKNGKQRDTNNIWAHNDITINLAGSRDRATLDLYE